MPAPRRLVLVGALSLAALPAFVNAQTCSTANLPSSGKTSPATGESVNVTVAVQPSGCSYTATTTAPWITVQQGDPLRLVIAPNNTASRRTGTVTIVNRTFTVSQLGQTVQPALSCTIAATPVTARQEGKAEYVGNLTGTCTGAPPASATGDFSLVLDTDIGSRVVTEPDITEATLILNNATPALGTTAFRGALTSTRSLRFARVPLLGLQSFRIVNVRADATSNFTGTITGRMEVRSDVLVAVPSAAVTLANLESGLIFTSGAGSAGPVPDSVQYDASFREGFATAFKTRSAEGGFTHAALGAATGSADAATRFLMRVSDLQPGRTLYAPVSIGGGAARLVSADPFGKGGTPVSGGSPVGAAYAACPTTFEGVAYCTWEVVSASPGAVETLTARMVLAGTGVATDEPQQASTNPHFGPTTRAIPWFQGPSDGAFDVFVDLSASPAGDPVRIGSNYAFSYRVSNDSAETATGVTIRGNAPPGFAYSGCTRSDGGTCQLSGNGLEATAAVGALDATDAVDITFTATPVSAYVDGAWTENVMWATSDGTDTDPGTNVTSSGVVLEACGAALVPPSASSPAAGGAASVAVSPSCSNWTAKTLTDWITITSGASGTNGGLVVYSVAANPATTPRTGRILIAGTEFVLTQAPVCTYALNLATGNIGAGGGQSTLQLTASHSSCAWSASSNQAWLTVAPGSGSGSAALTYTAAANAGAAARTGVITAGGRTFTLTQAAAPPACTFTMNPASANVGTTAGYGTFALTASGAGCAWSATSTQPWLTLPVSAGTGSSAAFRFNYAQNTGAARSAVVSAGGRQFTVSQAGVCSATTSPLSHSVPHAGQSIQQNITAPGCAWTARSNRSWVQMYPSSGTGSGSVTITVFPHFGSQTRTATITVGASTVTITQARNPETEAARFIRLLYFSFMGRVPSGTEVQGQIAGGLGRGDLSDAFLNSAEFNQGGRFVAGLYVGLLNRNAEFGGWQFQRDALARNVVSQDSLVSNFLNSEEYRQRFGTLSDADFIRQLYRQILLRDPSQADLNFHIGTLPGLGRVQVARNFLNAAEFRAGAGPRLTAFLLYATLLLRDGGTAELDSVIQQIQRNTPVRTLVEGFVTSAELNALLR